MTSTAKNEGLKKSKWRRNYKACLNCRARKVRCDLGPVDHPHAPPCVRCKRERRECLFTTTISGNSNVVTDTISVEVEPAISEVTKSANISQRFVDSQDKIEPQKNKISKSDPFREKKNNTKWKLELTSMQNTLQFLANAADSVAKKSDKEFTEKITNTEKSAITSNEGSSPDNLEERSTIDLSDENVIAPLFRSSGPQRPTAPLIEKLNNVRPKPTRTLGDIEYIGESKLLTVEEAIEFIDVFFSTMHPFFPHIPLQLHHHKELVQYPILLCAILTISTRYHPFSEFGFDNGKDGKRNIRVHEKLWDFCQRLISQTIWAEASTRSIGTVLAFIIFTEWNPRQIHWKKTDYANNEREGDEPDKPNDIDGEEEQTGIGAIRRSDRMAWMFTGSAIRLAQDMGFIETSTKVFVAAHMSDAFASMNMNQKSVLAENFSEISFENNKYRNTTSDVNDDDDDQNDIGNEHFYLEQILYNDDSKERWKQVLQRIQEDTIKHDGGITDLEREFLNDEYVLYYSRHNDEVVHQQQNRKLPFPLKFSFHQRAKIELIRIMLIGYDTIYYDKGRRKLASNDQVHNLAVLSILSPLIEGWYGTYRDLLKITNGKPYSVEMRKNKRAVHALAGQVLRESILCDYHYCQLYIYSLALHVDVKESKLRVNEIIRSAKYVELAYNAAKEIVFSAARVQKLQLLRYMPVRWVMRIVRAVAFLVKCYLTLTNSGGSSAGNSEAKSILKLCCISLDETIHVTKLAALTLKEATPDELHLAIRYSAILLYLCREMNLKKERNKRLLVSHGIIINEKDSESNEDKISNQQTSIKSPHNNANNEVKQHFEPVTANKEVNKSAISSYRNDTMTATKTKSDQRSANSIAEITKTIKSTTNKDTKLAENSELSNTDFDQLLSDESFDWFSGSGDIGLGFVEPWTEMLEQRFLQSGGTDQEAFEDIYNYFDNELNKTT